MILVNRGLNSRKACRIHLAHGISNCRRATATTDNENSLAGTGGSALSTYDNKLESVRKKLERVGEDVFVCCQDTFLELRGFARGEDDININAPYLIFKVFAIY